MEKKCNIIRDILPLYVEDMVSPDTREFVEEHLSGCTGCREECERLKSPPAAVPVEAVPMEHLKKRLRRRQVQTILLTALLVLALATSVFAVLTTPKYLPYTDGLIKVAENGDGTLTVTFHESVSHYECQVLYDSETNEDSYFIQAWDTKLPWDFPIRGEQTMEIPASSANRVKIYYTENNGMEFVPVYGSNDKSNTIGIALPQLFLTYYFSLALLALIFLLLARFPARRHETARKWLDRIWPIPACYLAAHLCTKGWTFASYSARRDFFIILLVAILLYCAALLGSSLYKAKKCGN